MDNFILTEFRSLGILVLILLQVALDLHVYATNLFLAYSVSLPSLQLNFYCLGLTHWALTSIYRIFERLFHTEKGNIYTLKVRNFRQF